MGERVLIIASDRRLVVAVVDEVKVVGVTGEGDIRLRAKEEEEEY